MLFPGEMGAILGAAAAARGEVVWASEGRSDATARRAREAGLRDVATVEELVRSSDVVLSVCPPAIAEDVARAVAAFGFEGLYVEANAIAPARVERIAAKLAERGIRVVDGSVISSGPINLYLVGRCRRRRGRGRDVRRHGGPGRTARRPGRRRVRAQDGVRRVEQDRRRAHRAGACDRPRLRRGGGARRGGGRPGALRPQRPEGLALGAGDGGGCRHVREPRAPGRARPRRGGPVRPLGRPPRPAGGARAAARRPGRSSSA